ncbi:MAG: glutamate--tRNA ligase [Actinomycetes bacterium]|jgi:glutamyl-tRNA synthetase|nr:glutamate--tRNA ligase [Actinomycetes bacterium]
MGSTSQTTSVRVRFAPSPTGTLHLGGARTALYNWAFARRCGGTFVLRIDDTDPERSTAENIEQILSALTWLGLDWDEGPQVGGAYGPYFQTQRGDNYARALQTMIDRGAAYRCFCSAEELAAKRDAARKGGGPSGYDRTCRGLSPEESQARADAGEPYVWRLAVPEDRGEVIVDDIVRGQMAFPADALDDMVIVRSDGSPTYNFASVVDDIDMGITHIIRGDDHVSNTPRQILVFEALGDALPRFAHLSMIWGQDNKKLSKRHGATGVEEYDALGYVPEALVNYLALLGWSLDGETTIVSPRTLCEHFSLERISKNPAVFDTAKLEWINGVYLREMGAEEFARRGLVPRLVAAGLVDAGDYEARADWYHELAPLVSERIKLLTEVVPLCGFLFVDAVRVDEKAQAKVLDKDPEAVSVVVAAALTALAEVAEWSTPAIEAALKDLPEVLDMKARVVFQVIRVAITGSQVSPPLFESMALLGRERSIARLQAI